MSAEQSPSGELQMRAAGPAQPASLALLDDHEEFGLDLQDLFHVKGKPEVAPPCEPAELRLEITQLCELFLGRPGRNAYSACICVYIYGSLAAYCSVFSESLATYIPGMNIPTQVMRMTCLN